MPNFMRNGKSFAVLVMIFVYTDDCLTGTVITH